MITKEEKGRVQMGSFSAHGPAVAIGVRADSGSEQIQGRVFTLASLNS